MNITYEWIANAGSIFRDETGTSVSFSSIKDNFYELNDRVGKIVHLRTENIYEHGYTGTEEIYGFIYQDDLSIGGIPNKAILKKINS